jgi:hypothetical protein
MLINKPNNMENNTKLDFEKYQFYKNTGLAATVAVEIQHQSKIEDLYHQYSGFKNVPENETIECYLVEINESGELYLSNKIVSKINVLEGMQFTLFK